MGSHTRTVDTYLVPKGGPRRRLAPVANTAGIPAQNHKFGDDAVEDSAVVVAAQAELDKVAACQGRLPWPKLDVNVPKRRVEYNLSIGRRPEGLNLRHQAWLVSGL